MNDTYTIAEAQAKLTQLCRSKRRFIIARRDKPVYVALPVEDFNALLETMELLANPKAMKALQAAKAGQLKYHELDLGDENFGECLSIRRPKNPLCSRRFWP
jgi:PHD/YefM family antitoxin component YafN of YafNO toxin-antitoxin module